MRMNFRYFDTYYCAYLSKSLCYLIQWYQNRDTIHILYARVTMLAYLEAWVK